MLKHNNKYIYSNCNVNQYIILLQIAWNSKSSKSIIDELFKFNQTRGRVDYRNRDFFLALVMKYERNWPLEYFSTICITNEQIWNDTRNGSNGEDEMIITKTNAINLTYKKFITKSKIVFYRIKEWHTWLVISKR